MAFVPLSVAPALRPWRAAGLRVLLLDAQTAAALREAVGPPKPAPKLPREFSPERASSPAERRAPFPRGEGQPTTPETRSSQARQSRTQQEQPPRHAPAAGVRPDHGGTDRMEPKRAQPAAREAGASPKVDPSLWPPFWRDLLRRTPPRPALLWTYPGLGFDLDGHADAAHRDFLRRLLGDMAMPKGSHAFWPFDRQRPDADDPVPPESVDAAHFFGGVALLKPDTVLLLTGTPPRGLGLDHLRPLQPDLVEGRRFVIMPHVDLLVREQGQYVKLITFLKALLGPRA